jgi:hypothetical protein
MRERERECVWEREGRARERERWSVKKTSFWTLNDNLLSLKDINCPCCNFLFAFKRNLYCYKWIEREMKCEKTSFWTLNDNLLSLKDINCPCCNFLFAFKRNLYCYKWIERERVWERERERDSVYEKERDVFFFLGLVFLNYSLQKPSSWASFFSFFFFQFYKHFLCFFLIIWRRKLA